MLTFNLKLNPVCFRIYRGTPRPGLGWSALCHRNNRIIFGLSVRVYRSEDSGIVCYVQTDSSRKTRWMKVTWTRWMKVTWIFDKLG